MSSTSSGCQGGSPSVTSSKPSWADCAKPSSSWAPASPSSGNRFTSTLEVTTSSSTCCFFNIPQVRYVVVELKIGKFQPECAGKLGFYLAVVDDRFRDPARHEPTVGILLCAGRNDTVVRYALSGATQPMAVAGYTYDTLPPKEQAALPSDTRVASALEAPVDVAGRQMTLAEYLEIVGAESRTDRPLIRRG
jgi:YhcG PDDEXK nuclease domain